TPFRTSGRSGSTSRSTIVTRPKWRLSARAASRPAMLAPRTTAEESWLVIVILPEEPLRGLRTRAQIGFVDSAHPADDAGDAVHGYLGAIGDAARDIAGAEDHRDTAL